MQPQSISTIRRHYLVVGSQTGISRFSLLPSALTGICSSEQWSSLHQSWATRSERALFQYSLATSAGPVNLTCVDCMHVAPHTEFSLSPLAIQNIIRPTGLSRQTFAAPSFTIVSASSSSSSSNNNTSTSTASAGMQNNNQQQNPTLMPTRSKHSDITGAYVASTVFIIVEMWSSASLAAAKSCVKSLDEQICLLNSSKGNIPNFVFVALSIEHEQAERTAPLTQQVLNHIAKHDATNTKKKNNNSLLMHNNNNNNNSTARFQQELSTVAVQQKQAERDATASAMSNCFYPEVLLSEVVSLSQSLTCGSNSRVDEVTLVESTSW